MLKPTYTGLPIAPTVLRDLESSYTSARSLIWPVGRKLSELLISISSQILSGYGFPQASACPGQGAHLLFTGKGQLLLAKRQACAPRAIPALSSDSDSAQPLLNQGKGIQRSKSCYKYD